MPGRRISDEETVQVNFRLETSLFDKLKTVAASEDRQVSDMARVFLKRALRDVPSAPPSANPTPVTSAPSANGAQATAPVTAKPAPPAPVAPKA